jgi:SAM-dependent methyltransferase
MATLPPLVATEERIIEGEVPARLFAEHRARYAFAARLVAGRRVLDVACGTGYGTPHLLAGGARSVVGVDRDGPAIAYARQRYGGPAISFAEGDACDPPVSGPFEVIVSFETLEHLGDPVRFLETCRRLLVRSGGILLVSTPYRHRVKDDGSPRNPFHRQEWRTEEFRTLLSPLFPSVELYGQALKLEKRRFPLGRWAAAPLAWLQGVRLGDLETLFPLPGPRFFGLWQSFPAYVIAVCRV